MLRGAAVGAVGLGLAGCTTSTETPTTAPVASPAATAAPTRAAGAAPAPTAAQPKRGGTARTMATSPYRNIEPHAQSGMAGTGSYGVPVCYSTLLTFKFGPEIKPSSYTPIGDLAESWTQPDDLTYIFKLRPGIRFHNIPPVNGREMTAEDIIYSYNRVRELKAFAGFLSGIARMEAPDRSTFKITLDKPNADMLDTLCQNQLSIVARERVEQTNGSLEQPPLIGTGPFVLDTLDLTSRATAKRNPDYFLKGQPYVDGFEVTWVVNDPSLQISAFRTSAANILGPSLTVQMGEDIKKAVPSAVVSYVPNDRAAFEFALNPALDLFKDVRVRQAISKAIDRKAVIDAVWLGHGGLTAGLSVPDASYLLPNDELNRLLGRDVEGAKRLLQQAGVTNLGFEVVVLGALSGAFVSGSEIIQASLKDLGVNMTLKPVDTTTWITAQTTQNFQGIVGTYAGAAPNGWLLNRYRTGGSQNYAKYSDPEMDKLIDQQGVMVKDPEGRKKVLQDIQRKIINDAVYIPVMLYHTPHINAAEVKGFYPPVAMSMHGTLMTAVWIDK
jgi:peptide/nickel transport system substrate-binding protein